MWQGNEYPLNWKKKAKAISLQLGLHRSKIPDLRVLIGIASVISFSKNENLCKMSVTLIWQYN